MVNKHSTAVKRNSMKTLISFPQNLQPSSQMLNLFHQELLITVGTYGSIELGHFKPDACAVSSSVLPYVISFCMHFLSKAGRLRQKLPQGRKTTKNISQLSFKLVTVQNAVYRNVPAFFMSS